MDTPLSALVLGARAHAVLAGRMPHAVNACFLRDDWTCHECGIRLPGFMEIDHIRGHQPCDAAHLRTICQFCHNLHHAGWAANRGRLRIIWAPAMSQRALTLMAWQVLLFSTHENESAVFGELRGAARAIALDAKRRERILTNIIGAAHAGGLIEALFALKRLRTEAEFSRIVASLDRIVRFWPTAVERMLNHPVDKAADLGQWRQGDFFSKAQALSVQHWHAESSAARLARLVEDSTGP